MDFIPESKDEVTGADLVLSGNTVRRVKVLELNEHGVHLDRTSLPANIRDEMNVKIGLRIPPTNLDGYMRVKGIVALSASRAEIRFLDLPRKFIATLNEYLAIQNAKRKLTETLENQNIAQQQRINAVSRNAVGIDLVNLLIDMLNSIAMGLEKRGERAGSDFERRVAIDDAMCLRQACSQNELLLNLSNNLLKLEPINKIKNRQAFNIAGREQSELLLNIQSIIDHLTQQLSIPLQQLSYRLEELQAGAIPPPCSPVILVKLLDKTFSELELSMEGRIYSLRCISNFTQQLTLLYQKLLEKWNALN